MKRIASVLFLGVLLFVVLVVPQGSADDAQVTYTPEQLLAVWDQVIALMREAECYPYVELQKGDRGYEVVFLQTRLAQLNYYAKAIDPQYGSGTYNAMRLFEKANGLQVDGEASVEDQRLLFRSDAKPNPGIAVGLEDGQTLPPGLVPTIAPTPLSTPTPKNTIWPGLQTVRPLVSGFKLPDLTTAAPTPTPKPTLHPGLQTIKPLIPGLDLPDLVTPKPSLWL